MNPSKNQQKDPPMLHHDPPMLCFFPASICDAGRCPSRQGAGEGLWRRRHWGDSVGGAGARTGATDVRGGDHLIAPGRQGGRASSQQWAGHPKNADGRPMNIMNHGNGCPKMRKLASAEHLDLDRRFLQFALG